VSKEIIAIIDYNMGNISSVRQALIHIAPNTHIIFTHDKTKLLAADRIVFPGQGAIAGCMCALKRYNLVQAIKQCILEKPFLGICLGLQLLFDHSLENNGVRGLGIIPGEVLKFPDNELKVPHMGWNTIKQSNHPLWHNIKDQSYFYSVHSYFVEPKDDEYTIGTSEYGLTFSSVIARDMLCAVQFHPEKSQHDGLQLLKNFVQLIH
jgi:glutamine amidotransferase